MAIVTIVTSKILRVINKSAGRRKIMEQHVDDFGKIWERRYNCLPVGEWDEVQALADYAAILPSEIVRFEKARIRDEITMGKSPADLSSPYLTNTQFARSVIRGMMAADDPLTIMPSAEYIDSNVTDSQLNNIFTSSQATKIRSRVTALVANKQFLLDDLSASGELT